MKDILVVDDDPGIISMYHQILEMEGYSVDYADTGEKALAMARETRYRLALLDINLPDMEGTDLLAKLRESRPSMKCIMVTGFATLENATRSLNLGANAYLVKPVNTADLLREIAEKLRKTDAEKEIIGEIRLYLMREEDARYYWNNRHLWKYRPGQ